jgi:uncharacterized cupredoxin-like copper-binding protein
MASILMILAGILLPSFWQQTSNSEKVINVTLTEWKIDMPHNLPAGSYNFKVTNSGTHSHTLKVKTKGYEAKLQNDLKPGENADLRVELEPGVYRVNCPIGFGPFDHGNKGMELDLTVGTAETSKHVRQNTP